MVRVCEPPSEGVEAAGESLARGGTTSPRDPIVIAEGFKLILQPRVPNRVGPDVIDGILEVFKSA